MFKLLPLHATWFPRRDHKAHKVLANAREQICPQDGRTHWSSTVCRGHLGGLLWPHGGVQGALGERRWTIVRYHFMFVGEAAIAPMALYIGVCKHVTWRSGGFCFVVVQLDAFPLFTLLGWSPRANITCWHRFNATNMHVYSWFMIVYLANASIGDVRILHYAFFDMLGGNVGILRLGVSKRGNAGRWYSGMYHKAHCTKSRTPKQKQSNQDECTVRLLLFCLC